MGMTMTQKILAAHAGLETVEAGQLIEGRLDLVQGNDITAPVAIAEFYKAGLTEIFDKYCKKLRIVPAWDVKLEFVEDPSWRKTGDFKVDCEDKKAVFLLNAVNPKQENLEEIIVHELMHLKMYPLDQVTESLIASTFEEGTPASNFAYRQFFSTLEQTVEELSKCFLLEFGDDREFSFGRCKDMKSFNELYDGLKAID